MDYTIQDKFSIKLRKDGLKLGFNTGLSNRSFAVTNFRDLRSVPGWIISPEGKIKSWEIDGVTEIDGQVVIYGPWEKGQSLADLAPGDLKINHLKRLARIARLFLEKEFPLKRFSPAAYYICDSGDWIVFPPLVVNFTLEHLPETQALPLMEFYNHPDLKNERAWAFSLSALSYEIITGEKAFDGDRRRDVHDKMRESRVIPPDRITAGCKKEISAFLTKTLSQDPELKGPGLEEWDAFFSIWETGGAVDEVSEEDTKIFAERREKEKHKRDKRYKRKIYLTVHKKSIIIGTILSALGIVLVISLLAAIFKPPLTKGMEAVDVVRAYYKSINDLNFLMIRDCIRPKALQEDVEAVKMEYLLSRQRQKLFGDPGIITAEEWVISGKPPIPQFSVLFGISGLNIQKKDDGVFIAEYDRWSTMHEDSLEQIVIDESPSSMEEKVTIKGLHIHDELHLEKDRKYWIIISIDRKSEEFFTKEVIWQDFME